MLNQYAVTFPRYQSTSVFPTSSNSWWNAKPFYRNAEPQRRAAKHLGHTWYIGKCLCKSNGVCFSTLSARIESMELRNGQGDRGHQGMRSTGGGGLVRVPNLHVCYHRLVGVAIPPVRRKGGRAELPKKGKWPPRGGDDSPHLSLPNSQPCFGGSKGLLQGNRQGW